MLSTPHFSTVSLKLANRREIEGTYFELSYNRQVLAILQQFINF